MSELTLNLPESLLISAQHAAEASQKSLQNFVLDMVQERVQQQNGTTPAKAQKVTEPSSSQSTSKSKLRGDWDGKRMKQDWAWVDTHYDTLADKYPGQWLFVYDQKVRGAHRDMGIAQDQATAEIGNVHKAGAIAIYVERDRYVR